MKELTEELEEKDEEKTTVREELQKKTSEVKLLTLSRIFTVLFSD